MTTGQQQAFELTERIFKQKLGDEGYRQVIDGAGFMHSYRIKDIVRKRLEEASKIFLSFGESAADQHITETVGFCNGIRYMINGESTQSLEGVWHGL